MAGKKNVWGWTLIAIAVLVYFITRELPKTASSLEEFGATVGYLIYAKIVCLLMGVAGIVLLITQDNGAKPVLVPIILVVAAFISFNDFNPNSVIAFVVLRIFNIAVAVRLFFLKDDNEKSNRNENPR